jgi:hypothetical protein
LLDRKLSEQQQTREIEHIALTNVRAFACRARITAALACSNGGSKVSLWFSISKKPAGLTGYVTAGKSSIATDH